MLLAGKAYIKKDSWHNQQNAKKRPKQNDVDVATIETAVFGALSIDCWNRLLCRLIFTCSEEEDVSFAGCTWDISQKRAFFLFSSSTTQSVLICSVNLGRSRMQSRTHVKLWIEDFFRSSSLLYTTTFINSLISYGTCTCCIKCINCVSIVPLLMWNGILRNSIICHTRVQRCYCTFDCISIERSDQYEGTVPCLTWKEVLSGK